MILVHSEPSETRDFIILKGWSLGGRTTLPQAPTLRILVRPSLPSLGRDLSQT